MKYKEDIKKKVIFSRYLRHLPKINIPTVVFIDKQDELISFSGLQNMIQDQNLDQWNIHPVKKDKTATKIKMHHLIIDETSVGNKMWQEIVDVIITHFLGRQSAGTIDKQAN